MAAKKVHYTRAQLKKAESDHKKYAAEWSRAEQREGVIGMKCEEAEHKLESLRKQFKKASYDRNMARYNTHKSAEKLDKIRKYFGLKTTKQESDEYNNMVMRKLRGEK